MPTIIDISSYDPEQNPESQLGLLDNREYVQLQDSETPAAFLDPGIIALEAQKRCQDSAESCADSTTQAKDAATRADSAAARAEATLPALEQEVAAAKILIDTEAKDAAEQAVSSISEAGSAATEAVRQEGNRNVALVAAAGDSAVQSVQDAERDATSEALGKIDAAATSGTNTLNATTASGTTTIGTAVTTGTETLNATVTAGTETITAATTTGTGTINTTVVAGKESIDAYVVSTQAELALKSSNNIWAGLNTFNSQLIANAGIILDGQDLIKTLYTGALMNALYCGSAASWTAYTGFTSGSGYNSVSFGTDSSVSYINGTASGILTRTDMTHQFVIKELAMYFAYAVNGRLTAVVQIDQNAFWSASNARTAYVLGASVRTPLDVPWETAIDPEYTPNVGSTPTVMLSATEAKTIRVDVYYKTTHQQVILPKLDNVSQVTYQQYFVFVWTPTRFLLHWLPSYPPRDTWQCVARVDGTNMGALYRVGIGGWNDVNNYRLPITCAGHTLNTYVAAGYGDWQTPLIHIIA